MLRNMFAVGMALLLLVFVCGWIMGDSAGPVLDGAKGNIRDKVEELIGHCEVNRNKAKAAIKQVGERIKTNSENVVGERIAIRMLDRDIASAQSQINTSKKTLASIEDRLTSGKAIYLVSGRELDESGVRSRVTKIANTISVANERTAFLTTLRERRQNRLTKMENLHVQAPLQQQKLQQSLDHLEAKLAMYEDVKTWIEDDDAAAMASGMFDKAHAALEEAHFAVDKELAKFDVMIEASTDATELAPMDADTEAAGNDLLAYVRGISLEVSQLR